MQREPWPRWLLVGVLYAGGQTVPEVASQLNVSNSTVKTHIKTAKDYILRTPYGSKVDLYKELVKRCYIKDLTFEQRIG